MPFRARQCFEGWPLFPPTSPEMKEGHYLISFSSAAQCGRAPGREAVVRWPGRERQGSPTSSRDMEKMAPACGHRFSCWGEKVRWTEDRGSLRTAAAWARGVGIRGAA